MSVQSEFLNFHKKIKLDYDVINVDIKNAVIDAKIVKVDIDGK